MMISTKFYKKIMKKQNYSSNLQGSLWYNNKHKLSTYKSTNVLSCFTNIHVVNHDKFFFAFFPFFNHRQSRCFTRLPTIEKNEKKKKIRRRYLTLSSSSNTPGLPNFCVDHFPKKQMEKIQLKKLKRGVKKVFFNIIFSIFFIYPSLVVKRCMIRDLRDILMIVCIILI